VSICAAHQCADNGAYTRRRRGDEHRATNCHGDLTTDYRTDEHPTPYGHAHGRRDINARAYGHTDDSAHTRHARSVCELG
jgi:hypothetical protein